MGYLVVYPIEATVLYFTTFLFKGVNMNLQQVDNNSTVVSHNLNDLKDAVMDEWVPRASMSAEEVDLECTKRAYDKLSEARDLSTEEQSALAAINKALKPLRSKRLANTRVPKALDVLRQIENLAAGQYEFTPEQKSKIVNTLSEALERIDNRFKNIKTTESGFSL